MKSALRAGIYTLGKTVTGLSSTNFFYGKARNSQAMPYCVFFGITNPFSFSSKTVFEEDDVQFNFYGTALASLETLAESFESIFDFSEDNLSVTGYKVMKVERTLTLPAKKTENVWQIILEYNFVLEKAR